MTASTLSPQENVELWQDSQDVADEKHQAVFL